MNILCVHQGAELYGSDRSFVQSLEAIRNKFPLAKIDVVLPYEGPLVDLVEKYCDSIIFQNVGNISRKQLKTRPIFAVLNVAKESVKAFKLMRQYDVIYLNTIVVFAFMIGAIFLKKRVIHHVREVPNNKLEKKIFSVMFNLTKSGLIFNSEFSQMNFKALLKKESHFVHNGVTAIENLADNKWIANKVNILCIGRLNGWKGQDVAVDTLMELRLKGIDAKLKIVGGTATGQEFYYDRLVKKVRERGVEQSVEFISFTNDTTEVYNWANIVIVPSTLPEPFGRVAIEAQSIGRPIAVSNSGGLKEIVYGDVGGVLCTPSDAIDFCDKIMKMIINENVFYSKCLEAEKNYISRFSNEIYSANFIRVFTSYLD